MNVVLEAYDKFSLDVDNFNDIRNQIYLDIFENTYYETLLNNDAKFKEMLSNYGKSVDSVDSSAKKLKKLCTNVYYPDSKINTKCSEYGSVYEQIVNAFVSDIDLYNENIVKYNEYQKENNGTLFLNSYVNKRKYLDFNKDGKYEGKEDN